MNRLKNLKEVRANKEAEMRGIFALCETEKRSRSNDEKTKWDGLKAEVDSMRDEISALEEQEAIDQRSAKPVASANSSAEKVKTAEPMDLRSQIQAWKDANQETIDLVRSKTEQRNIPSLEVRAIADMTAAKINAGGSAFFPNPGLLPGVIDLVRTQPTFWSRLTKGRTTLNPLVWTNKTNKEGAANFIGEGVLKPQVSFELATQQSVPKKVAERIRISTEMLNDVPGMESLIRNEMTYEIEKHANDMVLTGVASATDPAGVTTLASGFTLTTIEAGTAPSYADAIRAAIAQLQSLNFTDNLAGFINPIDAANMDLSKSADDGHYLLPPFVSASGLLVAGTPIYIDNNIPVGNLLIGDMTKYKIWMYENLTVRFGLNGDDFSENMVTVIAEMRFHQTFSTNHTGAFIYDSFADIVAAITTT
jgi:HK97 family phage major capsid protein